VEMPVLRLVSGRVNWEIHQTWISPNPEKFVHNSMIPCSVVECTAMRVQAGLSRKGFMFVRVCVCGVKAKHARDG
jgi:hypothetical protein